MKVIINKVLKIYALAVLYILLFTIISECSRGLLCDLIEEMQHEDFL